MMGLVLQSRQVPLGDVLAAFTAFEPACAAACAGRADRHETVLPGAAGHPRRRRGRHRRRPPPTPGWPGSSTSISSPTAETRPWRLVVGALESLWTVHVDELARRLDRLGSFAEWRPAARACGITRSSTAASRRVTPEGPSSWPGRTTPDPSRAGASRSTPTSSSPPSTWTAGDALRAAAVTGVGYTALERRSGRTRARAGHRGLPGRDRRCRRRPIDEVDGIASFAVMHDSVPTQAVATTLALPQLRFSLDIDLGGQAPCHLVTQAAAAIATGQADHVLVFRALNGRSGDRVGTMQFHGMGAQFRYPLGYDAYLMYCGMFGQRFLHETGQGELDTRGRRRRPAPVGRGQRAGVPPGAARRSTTTWPRRSSPSPTGRRLHGRGRRCLRRPRQRPRPGPRPPPPAGGRRRRLLPGGPPAGPRHRRPPPLGRLLPQLHHRSSATTSSAAPASPPPTSTSPRSTTASPAPC